MTEIYSSSILSYAALYGQSAQNTGTTFSVGNAGIYKNAILGCLLEEANDRQESWQR